MLISVCVSHLLTLPRFFLARSGENKYFIMIAFICYHYSALICCFDSHGTQQNACCDDHCVFDHDGGRNVSVCVGGKGCDPLNNLIAPQIFGGVHAV